MDFLPLSPSSTLSTMSALSIEIVKKPFYSKQMRPHSDEAEEHHYRPTGVIIMILWSTEHEWTCLFIHFPHPKKFLWRVVGERKKFSKKDETTSTSSIEKEPLQFHFFIRMGEFLSDSCLKKWTVGFSIRDGFYVQTLLEFCLLLKRVTHELQQRDTETERHTTW